MLWLKTRAVIIANIVFALSTYSLPLSPLEIGRIRVERRRIPYSVVPVDGGIETSTSEVPMVVTVSVSTSPPITETITATATATATATTTATITVPEPPVAVAPSNTTSWKSRPTSSAPTRTPSWSCSSAHSSIPIPSSTPSSPAWIVPSPPIPSLSFPSSNLPVLSTSRTSLLYHPPALTPPADLYRG